MLTFNDGAGDVTTTHTYMVAADDTLEDVATALAEAINADADAAFVAGAEGANIVIVNLTYSFATEFGVTPANAFTIDDTLPFVRIATLDDTLRAGDTLTVNLVGDGVTSTHSYTVAAVGDSAETPAKVVAALAAIINAEAPFDYTAMSDGATLVIVNRGGHPFTMADVYVIDTSTANATTVTLTGTPIVGETWSIRLEFDGIARTISHTVAIDATGIDTLAEIAEGLAAGINVSAGNEFSSTTDGSKLIIVKRTDGDFDTFFLTQAAPFGQTATTTAIVTLSGIPVSGEIWTVSIGGLTFSVTVGGTYDIDGVSTVITTLDQITGALATAINTDTSPEAAHYTAMTEGDTLIIVNQAGSTFVTTFEIIPATGYTVDATTPVTALMTLQDDPVPDKDWTLVITVEAVTRQYTHTVTAGETKQQVAEALAVAINNDVNMPDFTATVEADTLIIVNRAGTPFSFGNSFDIDATTATTTMVTLGGKPVADETWEVTVAGQSHTVTVGGTVNSVVVDTLGEIAKALAWQIESDPLLSEFTAMTEGSMLLIVKRTAGDFTTSVEITPVGTITSPADPVASDASTVAAATIALTGTPVVGEEWEVELTFDSTTTTHSWMAMTGDTLAIIAQKLADDINTNTTSAAEFAATTTEDSQGNTLLVIVKRATGSFTAELSVMPAGNLAAEPAATTSLVTLSGTPVGGDTWTVLLDSMAYDVTVTGTLADVAAGLADAINSVVDGVYTALAVGTDLMITTTGAEFTALLSRTSDTAEIEETSSGGSVNISLTGTPLDGETWTIRLDHETSVDFFTYDVYFETLTEIAAAIAADIDATTGFVATTEGETIVIVSTADPFITEVGFTPLTAPTGGGETPARPLPQGWRPTSMLPRRPASPRSVMAVLWSS